MNIFQMAMQKFQKKSVQLAYSWQYGKPVWSTQKDEQYITEAYKKIVWVYACVSMIASCSSSVPWCLYRKRGSKLIEIEEHPILNMVNNNANPYCSSRDFFDIWSTYLALQGKFFAEFNNPYMPTQMFFMYPHFVRPIPDEKIFVSGYEYDIGGSVTPYKAESVLWSKFFDPLDVYQGLSPVRAQSRTIDTENEAVNWSKTMLQNGAVPPGAIQVVNPSPELANKLRKDWIDRYGGSKNARVPLVLDAEKASYINFGLDPVDMDFMNQRKLDRTEICACFGVPGQVVGDPEGQTYANYEEALKAFWQNTIIPRYLNNMRGVLNNSLVVKYADNLYLDYNLDDITVLHESIDSIALRVTSLFEKNILTQNESREAIGYDKDPDGDIYNYELGAKMIAAMSQTTATETTATETTATETTATETTNTSTTDSEPKKKV